MWPTTSAGQSRSVSLCHAHFHDRRPTHEWESVRLCGLVSGAMYRRQDCTQRPRGDLGGFAMVRSTASLGKDAIQSSCVSSVVSEPRKDETSIGRCYSMRLFPSRAVWSYRSRCESASASTGGRQAYCFVPVRVKSRLPRGRANFAGPSKSWPSLPRNRTCAHPTN